MKVLLTGASGLVGRALSFFLQEKGHIVGRALRGKEEIALFEGWDVVINLAGESIAKGFWSKKKKKKILESRVLGTENLVRILHSCKAPPRLFISTSAIGFYGNQKGKITEQSSSGEGFLAKVCVEWEKAAKQCKNSTIRVVIARFGIVLSPIGGFLKQMRSLFLWGLGGKIGDGRQFMSWVAIDDLVKALYYIIEKEEIEGAVNIVSPNPVRQEVFAKKLAAALHRPCFFLIPKRLLLGEKAKELILTSSEVYPEKLLKNGFIFQYPELSDALGHLLF